MTVIIETIKNKSNVNIENNEINVYNHETNKNINKYLNTYIGKINNSQKILYFSFYNSKKYLIEITNVPIEEKTINFVSFSNMRKPQYRIKTIMEKEKEYCYRRYKVFKYWWYRTLYYWTKT